MNRMLQGAILIVALFFAYVLQNSNRKTDHYILTKDQSRIEVQSDIRFQSLFDDYLRNTVVHKR